MRTKNTIQVKSFAFAVRIIKLSQYLVKIKQEVVVSKQLLRCGTSIGANVEESQGAFSKRDFIYKINVAYKEALECRYWLRLLFSTGYLTSKQHASLDTDIEELCKLLAKIQLTLKKTLPLN